MKLKMNNKKCMYRTRVWIVTVEHRRYIYEHTETRRLLLTVMSHLSPLKSA